MTALIFLFLFLVPCWTFTEFFDGVDLSTFLLDSSKFDKNYEFLIEKPENLFQNLTKFGIDSENGFFQLKTDFDHSIVAEFFVFNFSRPFDQIVFLEKSWSIRNYSKICEESKIVFRIIGTNLNCPYTYFFTSKPIRNQIQPSSLFVKIQLDSKKLGQCFPFPVNSNFGNIYLISLAIENPNCSTILILPNEFQLLKTNKSLIEFFKNVPELIQMFKKSSNLSESKSKTSLLFLPCFLPILIISAIFVLILLIVLIVVGIKCSAMKKRGKYVLPIDEKHDSESKQNNSKKIPNQKKSSKITDKNLDSESSIISGNTSLTQQITLEPSKSADIVNKK